MTIASSQPYGATPAAPDLRPSRGLFLSAGLLGFCLGGFFDGILLHQVLQWHHFLSLVPGEALRDIRNQILADGLFHVAVYLLSAIGLVGLWRTRGGLAQSGSRLLGSVFLGFALWQAVDVIVFHWIVGIHRVRVDVPDPLTWDIGWLVVTGLPPLAVALWLMRRPDRPSGPSRQGAVLATVLAALVLASGPIAAMPPAGQPVMMVLYPAGQGTEASFAAAVAAGARVAWSDPSGELLAVDLSDGGSVIDLYRNGAVMVGWSSLGGGCLSWTRRPA
ncbi:DUF2243 domain-containing protein [Pararoseomonas indoligenes]|uniref:DUF2243 domain-containing protein n=1 Tax=Roseomonas indoligenes TaxID=2820811 RepID=A0A940N3R8_9PROT|nr:DUF2243 domain-containing protein [Pararoseomonas indoligenes]MBP0496230.1 DUF2243 domain-containing protein [Pararoseomonas indoligenes]